MTAKLLGRCCVYLVAGLVLCGCGGSITNPGRNQTIALAAASDSSTAGYSSVVQQLYIAYFGRPADAAGLANFEAALLAAGAPTTAQGLSAAYSSNPTIRTLVDSFGTSAESSALYAGNTTAFVTTVFKNVLNRSPQPAGLAYWVQAIDNGTLSRGDAALSIMSGALDNTTPQGLLDAALITTKVAVGAKFTAAISPIVYRGSTAAAGARQMLGTVTSTTNPDAFSSTSVFAGFSSGLTLIAGDTTLMYGSMDGPAANARFGMEIAGIAFDATGNLYIAERISCTIRKLSTNGVVTTIAGSTSGYPGSADGTGANARFNLPQGIAVASSGNIYVADTGNHTIRKITSSGVVTTVAGTAGVTGSSDGAGAAARFNQPNGIAIDSSGNLYVTDTGNNTLRKITPSGIVTTLAGTVGSTVVAGNDGTGANATFSQPGNITIDSSGVLYVRDNIGLRKVTTSGVVSTIMNAYSLHGTYRSSGLAMDASGNAYVLNDGSLPYQDALRGNTVSKVSPAGVATIIAGNWGSFGLVDGPAAGTEFSFMYSADYAIKGMAFDTAGNLYIGDTGNSAIRKISADGSTVSTVAGPSTAPYGSTDGTGAAARFLSPSGFAVDASGNIYTIDGCRNCTIRKITPDGTVSTLAGTLGRIYDEQGQPARFDQPHDIALRDASSMYVSTEDGIRIVTVDGNVSTLSLSGLPSEMSFYAMTVDASSNIYATMFGAGTVNGVVQSESLVVKITPAGVLTTLAGGLVGNSDGVGTAAKFGSLLQAIATDNSGNVYVSDTDNVRIRKITPAGVVTTLVTTGDRFGYPTKLTIDESGNLYVADIAAIRKITPAGVVTTPIGLSNVVGNQLGALPGLLHDINGLQYIGSNTLLIGSGSGVVRATLP